VVENLAGSAAISQRRRRSNSPPDGRHLLFVAPKHRISTRDKKLPYDCIRDTTPSSPHHAAHQHAGRVEKRRPVKTVQEFIDYCKGKPGKLSYRVVEDNVHLGAHVVRSCSRRYTQVANMVHVPYRGSADSPSDIISKNYS